MGRDVLCVEKPAQLRAVSRCRCDRTRWLGWLADIGRDRDASRRSVSLSKVKKFELLKNVRQPARAELEKKFGPMPKPNDVVDVALLHTLDLGAVDFVVTEAATEFRALTTPNDLPPFDRSAQRQALAAAKILVEALRPRRNARAAGSCA